MILAEGAHHPAHVAFRTHFGGWTDRLIFRSYNRMALLKMRALEVKVFLGKFDRTERLGGNFKCEK